uniref:BY PROTMAP: gi/472581772/gb/EMS19487.1/ nuclear transcription factor Y, gamma [Rhodosporidium toruloides NP11] gi/647402508/emb/CDR48741.1/ RHTO0S20e00364g1_1 [Rhodosporidium toruloides] n=1 Tax=Rhodotorula toruloides TaxID=5286 RepID=A0A0K3CQY2_RHOTO
MDQDQPQQPAKPKAPRATTSTKNRANSPEPYRSHSTEISIEDLFWQHAMNVAEHHEDDFKHQALPLARIKKVAKMDPEVQNTMISSEVTILFEKACQIFIQELTARAHLVSMSAKRRTISRADVAQAVSRSDMFDFLIDIVPRTERPTASTSHTPATPASTASGSGTRSRPSRTRRASQRESPRRRREDDRQEGENGDAGLQGGQQGGNVGGMDMSAAAAAGVGGYYLPGMGDPTNPFPPAPLGWPAGAFDYPGAQGPIDPSLPAFFPPGPVDPSTGLLQPPPHPQHVPHPHLDPQLQQQHQQQHQQ